MDEALSRAQEALDDAQSDGKLPADQSMPFLPDGEPLDSPLDRDTMDEDASTQMGGWDGRRRPTYKGD
jgi:hypothetical protein